MKSKWLRFLILCTLVCLLIPCGCSRRAEVVTEPDVRYTASSEKLIYIEFQEECAAESITASLTPANQQNPAAEIPLTYSSTIHGCMLTLEEGAYCIKVQYATAEHHVEQERYFVVDADHSYYHINFTDLI